MTRSSDDEHKLRELVAGVSGCEENGMSEKPPQQSSITKRVGRSIWPLALTLLFLFLILATIGWSMSGRSLGALWPEVWLRYSRNREDLVPLVTLAAGIIAAWVALGQLQTARRQADTAAERNQQQVEADLQRRITESFTKAVEQLGSQHLQVRVGGIYALERISRESNEDYRAVMETLTAFVRELARSKNPDPANAASAKERIDIQTDVAAVMAVVRRRRQQNWEQEQREGWHLDLREAKLRGANLRQAHLEWADLRGADLDWADLRQAHLEGANLKEARLEWANLLDSSGLTQSQLDKAVGDAKTQLPEGVKRPDHWRK